MATRGRCGGNASAGCAQTVCCGSGASPRTVRPETLCPIPGASPPAGGLLERVEGCGAWLVPGGPGIQAGTAASDARKAAGPLWPGMARGRPGACRAPAQRRVLAVRVDGSQLSQRRKGDPGKVELASLLRPRTTMTLKWIAQPLKIGA